MEKDILARKERKKERRKKTDAINRIILKAEKELLLIKSSNRPKQNAKLSLKYEADKRKEKSFAVYGEDLVLTNMDEWHQGFLHFCNRTHNIYGSRVDRKHLLEYANDYRQRGSSSDESVETAPDNK